MNNQMNEQIRDQLTEFAEAIGEVAVDDCEACGYRNGGQYLECYVCVMHYVMDQLMDSFPANRREDVTV